MSSAHTNAKHESLTTDVLILGAGASGLMCAATAGYRGRSVLLVDHAPKAAAKIRISGGGKANFTNVLVSPENFLCKNPHFVKSALARYQPQDFIDLVDRHGLEYEQREKGKLFCRHRAGDLIQILQTECDWAGVSLRLKTDVLRVIKLGEGKGFIVETSQGAIACQSLVVATGALSFPKLKASDFGYRLAEQFGLKTTEKVPGLVPFVFNNRWLDFCQALSGVSLDVKISVTQQTESGTKTVSFEEAMLFTHQGLSGPGILQISNYWQAGQPIVINLLPKQNVEAALLALKHSNASLTKWLQRFWTKRFTQSWLEAFPMPIKLGSASNQDISEFAKQITEWTLYPEDTAGYGKAEVTLGGVDTDEVSSQDFEAKKVSGLFFIGEVLDVTGQLGGYNFQWAWASGFAAGQKV